MNSYSYHYCYMWQPNSGATTHSYGFFRRSEPIIGSLEGVCEEIEGLIRQGKTIPTYAAICITSLSLVGIERQKEPTGDELLDCYSQAVANYIDTLQSLATEQDCYDAKVCGLRTVLSRFGGGRWGND